MESSHITQIVDQIIQGRRSIHQFLNRPIEARELRALLAVASRAPSGTNTQPWRVYAVAGALRVRLCQAMLAAHHHHHDEHDYGYKYYPDELCEPYSNRQAEYWQTFWGPTGHNVPKKDEATTHSIISQNFTFFGAPVGLIFTIDKRLEVGSWFDYGMFVGNLMTAARARGLDTCPQVSIARYHKIVRAELGISDNETVMAGMALGYADPSAPINSLAMGRQPVENFATLIGFPE